MTVVEMAFAIEALFASATASLPLPAAAAAAAPVVVVVAFFDFVATVVEEDLLAEDVLAFFVEVLLEAADLVADLLGDVVVVGVVDEAVVARAEASKVSLASFS